MPHTPVRGSRRSRAPAHRRGRCAGAGAPRARRARRCRQRGRCALLRGRARTSRRAARTPLPVRRDARCSRPSRPSNIISSNTGVSIRPGRPTSCSPNPSNAPPACHTANGTSCSPNPSVADSWTPTANGSTTSRPNSPTARAPTRVTPADLPLRRDAHPLEPAYVLRVATGSTGSVLPSGT
jgi:hypothetical protein